MKKISKYSKVIIVVAGTLLIIMITVLVWHNKRNKKPELDAPVPTPSKQAAIDTEDVAETLEHSDYKSAELMEISTKYGLLQYPGDWPEETVYEELDENGLVSEIFYCQLPKEKIKLFAIHFGDTDAGDELGILHADGDEIHISLETFALDDAVLSPETADKVYAMAEAVNTVIQSIQRMEGFSTVQNQSQAILFDENVEPLQIATDYCTLEYPSYWEAYLKYETQNEMNYSSEIFYCVIHEQQVPLFAVHFGDVSAGDRIGYLMVDDTKMAVSLEAFELPMEQQWTTEEENILYGMAEGINDVAASITENPAYTAD